MQQNLTQEKQIEFCKLFNEYLMGNQPAIEYLNERGITKDIIESQCVGFCPPFLSYWWPLLKGRITIPIKDVHGKIVAFAGRQYPPTAEHAREAIRQMLSFKPIEAEKMVQKWDRAKWINEPYPKIRHLYNLNYAKDYIRKYGYAVVVEGYFDAGVMASNYVPNTAAVCGIGLSERHIILLSRYCKHIILMTDGDEAGEKAVEKWIPKINEAEMIQHVVTLPPNYDPDEFVIKIGGKRLKKILDSVISENKKKLILKLRN